MTGRPASCECGECKKCKHREYMKRWYDGKTEEERRAWVSRRNRQTMQKNDKARYERDKAKRLEASRLWREKDMKENPEKWKARHSLNNALRDGRIERGTCAVCGSSENIEAHHNDYSDPLIVEWLCRTHHVERHQISVLRRE